MPFVVRMSTGSEPGTSDGDHRPDKKGTAMKYLLLIYGPEVDPSAVSPEEMQAEMEAYNAFTRHLRDRKANLGGEALEPTSTATTVRVRDEQVQTTDGPFAETKEALGGYYLVQAKDLDEAIDLASRIPGARNGSIEVRPVMEFPEEYSASEPTPASAG
jgi:hypothetical protein